MQRDFYNRDTVEVSKDLIGKYIVRKVNGITIRAMITETEAYCDIDQASHCYGGKVTNRNKAMFGETGHCYMYFIYGCHNCFNISAKTNTQKAGAVLIRAVKPIEGIDEMIKLRNTKNEKNLSDCHMSKTCKTPLSFTLVNGPGKLCKSMSITKEHYGIDLTDINGEIYIDHGENIHVDTIKISTRIGISKDKDRLWRFYI